jgi:RNA binding exosome subunit
MGPPFREVLVRVLVHATEDENRLGGVLRNLLPQGVELQRTELEGHHGNPVLLLEARIKGKKEVEGLLSLLLPRLEGSWSWKPRKGEKLYLRLDKQQACRGRWVLGKGDEVIHLTLKPRGYPYGERKSSNSESPGEGG